MWWIVCVCVCVIDCLHNAGNESQNPKPTIWSTHSDRCGARCWTVIGQFGVLLALKCHLILAQLVAVHPAVWVGQKNEQHVTAGTRITVTSTNWLLLASLWKLSVLQMQLSNICMLTVKQTNSSQIFWRTGEGKNVVLTANSFFFSCVARFSSQHATLKTTLHLPKIASLYLLPTRQCLYLSSVWNSSTTLTCVQR